MLARHNDFHLSFERKHGLAWFQTHDPWNDNPYCIPILGWALLDPVHRRNQKWAGTEGRDGKI